MTSFGERLRKEREARGIDLRSISESTKISPRVLKALESNQFGDLPGRVYNRGFVRAYAEALGVDPASLLEAYEEEERRRGPVEPPPLPTAASLPRRAGRSPAGKRRWRAWPLLLAATATSAAAVTLALWPPRDAASSTTVAGAPLSPARQPVDIPRTPDATQYLEAPPEAGNGSHTGMEPLPALLSGQIPEEDGSLETSGITPAPEALASPPLPEENSERVEADPPPVAAVAEPADPDISVREWGIGAGVVDHELVGRRSLFQVGEKAWFWTRLAGADAGEVVRHVWLHEGEIVSSADITIGGPNWRIYTRRILEPGDSGAWVAEVRDAAGDVLAAETFVCAPERAAPKPPPVTPPAP